MGTLTAIETAAGVVAPAVPAAPQPRRRRPAIAAIAATLFFASATVVYTFPLALSPGSLLLAGLGDHPSEAALIGWTAHQLLHSPRHLFDTEFFYPYSHTEAYWQSVLVPGLLATPVMAATGDALLATNVVVLLSLALSGLLTAALAWSLTHRAIPSLLAGVVFAFFPNRLEHLNSPMVQMGVLLPVSLWAWLRFLDGTRWRDLVVLVFALWARACRRSTTRSRAASSSSPSGWATCCSAPARSAGAAAFRAPGRWALAYALPLALVAGVALAALTNRLPRRARAAAGAIVLLIVMLECLPLPIPWERRPPIPLAHRWLAQQPGDFAVMVLPATDPRHAAWAMLWATTHWKRLVNGAFVFVPPVVQTLADEEGAVDGAALAATLRSTPWTSRLRTGRGTGTS